MKGIEEVVKEIENRLDQLRFLEKDASELGLELIAHRHRAGQFELLRLLKIIKGEEEI